MFQAREYMASLRQILGRTNSPSDEKVSRKKKSPAIEDSKEEDAKEDTNIKGTAESDSKTTTTKGVKATDHKGADASDVRTAASGLTGRSSHKTKGSGVY
jgi:hypothetical protein